MKLDTKKSDDSYSMAAKERMTIELENLVAKLNEVGSALATANLFHRVSIDLDGKRRRLRDFAEIDLGPDPTAGTFRVVIHNKAAITEAIATLKENGFINIDTSSTSELKVVKPRLTAEQEDQLETEVKRRTKSSLSKLESIKSDALQRIQAAIQAEFIEPVVSKRATEQLDDLIDDATTHASIIGLIRRKQLIGGGLQFDSQDEESLYKRTNDSLYKEVAAEMLRVEVDETDD